MGQTPILRLPYPELGQNADGPAAFADLATAVENTRSINRGWSRERGQGMVGNDAGTVVNPSEQRQIMPAQTIAPVVNGWAEVSFDCDLYQATGTQPGTWAGNLRMYMNGILCGESRFHNHGLTMQMHNAVVAVVQVPLTLTSMVFGVNMVIDQPSNTGVRAVEWEFNIRQYGAGRGA
jgi:hypothetical protein